MRLRRQVVSIVLLGCLGTGLESGIGNAAPLRDMTEEDGKSWRQPRTIHLSPDGAWFVYLLTPAAAAPEGGPSEVVIRSTSDETERRYPIGHSGLGAGNLKMSRSGKWIAFHVAPKRKSDAQMRLGVAVVETGSGARRDYPGVSRFDFLGDSEDLILLLSYPSEPGRKESELTVQRLSTDGSLRFSSVSDYSVSPSRGRVVWTGASGVYDHNAASGVTRPLDETADRRYEPIVWSASGNAFAVLRAGTQTPYELVVVTELNAVRPTKSVMTPGSLRGFPMDHEFHATLPTLPQEFELPAALRWRDDERGLFIGIRSISRTVMPVPAVPRLALWHWQDDLPPAERRREATRIRADLGFVSLGKRHFVRLTDPSLRYCTPHARASVLLAYDLGAYGPLNANASTGMGASLKHQLRDYQLVDIRSGVRRPFIRGLPVHSGNGAVPQLSPDGRFVVYKNHEGDYVAYEIASAIHRNLTAELPTRFYFAENDPRTGFYPKDPNGQGFPFIQGWTLDGAHVLVSDHYDVWALPLLGGRAVNLTGNGRQEEIYYRVSIPTDARMGGAEWRDRAGKADIDLSAPIYFKAHDIKTGFRGLARWNPASSKSERLHWEFADTKYFRAEKADVHLYMRWSAVASFDFYRMDQNWRPQMRLTDINPQQRELRLPPGVRYLRYTTARGDVRRAVLRLPLGYVEGQSYPAIVGVYKTLSGAVHEQRLLGVMYDSEAPLLWKGYALLFPDIDPRVNESGAAALESVTAAVEAAVATGIVDRNRLGLTGHSYGGYETAYIVSQTHLFKAAVPYAGAVNLWSDYGGVNGSQFRTLQYETSQPYFAGPWWEHWEAYLQNSPLYHARRINTPLLLVHGDADTAISFTESLQLFSNLRRMGDKPVVLLQYIGEDHQLSSGDGYAERDYQRKMVEFFDHFLKGAPAPAWWTNGLSSYEGQAAVPN